MMRKIAILGSGLILALLILFVALWTGERQAKRKLVQENTVLQKQVEEQAENIAQAKAENERMVLAPATGEEMERMRQEHNELLKLRAENAQTRQVQQERSRSPTPVPTPRMELSGFTVTSISSNLADAQMEENFQRQLVSPANATSWSPGQAAGAPDTFQAGDIKTAWASQERDAGAEWLKLEYELPVELAQIRIRETHNPGAVSAITATMPNGAEVTLWQGDEPKSKAPVEMAFDVPSGIVAQKITVHLDTSRVPGWNEIDAVELVGRDGSRQWAKSATSSSYFGQRAKN